MNEIIRIHFYSGRSERYIMPAGTAETLRALANTELPHTHDCIYLEALPKDWYRGWYLENHNSMLDVWECRDMEPELVVLQWAMGSAPV